MQIQFFFSIIVGTCALTLALSFYAFRQRDVPGTRLFGLFAIAEAFLALSELLSMVSKTNQGALLWFNLRIPFLALTPVLWLFFVVRYYHKQRWITKWGVIAGCVIPVLTILFQNLPISTHFWVQQNVSFYQTDSFWLVDTNTRIPGFWYYIHTCYSLLLTLGSTAIIASEIITNSTGKRFQSIAILAGSLVYLGVGIYPAFFPVTRPALNPIVPGMGLGAFIQIIAIFTLNFLKPPADKKQQLNDETIKNQERESLNLLVLVFVVIAVSIASLGFLSFKNFQREYREQVESQLTSISLMKVADIQKWRNERINDAQAFYKNESFSELVTNYLKNPSIDRNIELIQAWFTAYAEHDEYENVFFIDITRTKIISLDDTTLKIASHLVDGIPQVLEKEEIEFVDFHRDSENSPVFLATIIPIYSSYEGIPLGVVVMRIDPNAYLYPLILRWPVPSNSAETALVRMENNKVLYLTALRFEPDSLLSKYIDLSETNRPSVKAVTGSIGIVEGVNYRGKQVIADVREVPGTSWFLVSRIDQEEVAAPLLERERLSWILYSSLILATGVALNLIWRQQRMRSLITNNKIQTEILERDRKLKEAQEMAHLGFWYWDVKTGEVEWSDEVYKIFQIEPKNFKPRIDSILALSPWPEEQKRGQELIDRAIKTHQPGMYEQKFLRSDNSVGYYSSTFLGQFDENDELTSIVGSVMDITDRTIKDQALRVSEHRFRTLFEHAAVGVAIIDTNTGQYLEINHKYCDFLGYSKDEMLQRTFMSVTEPGFIKINMQYNQKLLNGKISEYSLEKKYVRKDGKTVWGELNASALWEPGETPEVYMHIAVVLDITDQKIAELGLRESEKKFRETVANLDEGFYSSTMDGVLVDHNEAFNRILGLPEHQDARGLLVPDFWENGDDRQKYLAELQKNGTVSSYQISAKKINGEPITILLSSHIVKSEKNEPLKIDGVFLDITSRIRQEEQLLASQVELQKLLEQAEQSRRALLTIVEDQKLAQEQIKLLNKTLEERVNQRTAQLKESNEELESFAYSISHDLRAPLRAIDGYSRILEQDYAKVLDTEGIRLLNIVRSSTKNLDRLITDLLSLSRVGRSELKLDDLDMDSMVNSVYEELMTPEIQEKVEFIVRELPVGFGDPTLIRHVWMNLISNAIKYSTPNEHPRIEITGFSDSERCIYTITDNGVGFNPDFRDKLFGLFQRLHKASDFEGTGVGLAIVQRIVKRHNGEVWGDGKIDAGATFSFTLPLRSDKNE